MTANTVNLEYVGRQYPPGEPYAVGREKIREFAAAVGAEHAIHRDVDAARTAGYADVVAPTTFAVIVAQRAEAAYIADPQAGIDFSRVVHADERFIHHRPIVAGDELVTVVRVESITERAGIAFVTTRAEIAARAADGPPVPVSTVTSTLAIRGADA